MRFGSVDSGRLEATVHHRFHGRGRFTPAVCNRTGYATGYKSRTIHTRLGPLTVEVPQARPFLFGNFPAL